MLPDNHSQRIRHCRGKATARAGACAVLVGVLAAATGVPSFSAAETRPATISNPTAVGRTDLQRLPPPATSDAASPRLVADFGDARQLPRDAPASHVSHHDGEGFGLRLVAYQAPPRPIAPQFENGYQPSVANQFPIDGPPVFGGGANTYDRQPLLTLDQAEIQPPWLRDPDTRPLVLPEDAPPPRDERTLLLTYMDPPQGFAGRSRVPITEVQTSSHFVPVEDRWRLGYPEWDRYGNGHPPGVDYPYTEGAWWDPYNQNVLKGDYPIFGQYTFFNLTATSLTLLEYRQVPTATTPFESTVDPFQEEFFGEPEQFFAEQFVKLSFNVFHGVAAFKPFDWQVKVTPVFNANYLDVEELAIVDPDVRKGTTRGRDDWALEEWFVEAKLADLSPNYDFLSIRGGSQLFVSDFRGFVFADTNRAVRLFGNQHANRTQFNFIWFDQMEKDTNSELNTFEDRHQNTFIANVYRQDFIWPGFVAQASFHYNRDKPSFHFDDNDVLVRPDPTGVFRPHEVSSYYIGFTGNGHIERVNVSHAFYWVFGQDELNPLAGKKTDINAQMVAVELSYDRDWARFRTSFLWASGDNDIDDGEAEGFDAIFDNPNFAGGEFSYWNRQAIRLFGVNLTQRKSIVPNLRSSKTEGQTNFVNPGLFLFNVGMDADLTPKLKVIGNVNFLWFQEVAVLEQFTFQEDIDRTIGTDLSLGVEYRPFLNDNAIVVAGISGLLPGEGFEDLYGPLRGDADGLFAGFAELILTY